MLDPDISTTAALRHLHRDEPTDADDRPHRLDRRRFLQLVGMGLGAGLVAGPGTSLLDAAIPGHDPSAWAAGPLGANEGILVVIGMYGGNDGLNTVVPFTDGNYHDQHAPIAFSEADTLRLDARTGLHPNLSELKRFWDTGQLAIVEGIGHRQVDFSHFSSMARWMSGYDTAVPSSGWIGRWLDGHLGSGPDLYTAAEIGSSLPLHMIGRRHVGTTVPVGKPGFGAPAGDGSNAAVLAAIRDLGGIEPAETWSGRIGRTQIAQLDLARRLTPIVPERERLPEVDIVAKLDVAARLINANLGFRVLTAGFGDFDSHAGQPPQHDARMAELNSGLAQFFAQLHPDWAGRVTVMTFSEFGRTSHANDSQGSDHGSSAPHFVLGAKVKGGFHGQRPSLAGLRAWDRMPTHVGMADYYGSVLDGWFGGGASEALPDYRASRRLDLFSDGPDSTPVFPGLEMGEFVAVTPQRIFDTRSATGGPPGRIGPQGHATVKIAGVAGMPAGVRAVAVNISSIKPSSHGTFITAYPSGLNRPDTATVNPRVGAVVPNMSVLGVGADGTITLSNDVGDVDVTVDLMGYFQTPPASRLTPLTPARILDTRYGTGAPKTTVRSGGPLRLKVIGVGGVPASGVEAVVLNLTSFRPSATGWITAWPTGVARPDVANLSYIRDDVVPNMVVCKVGDGGTIELEPSHGDLHLIADVVGFFGATGSRLSAIPPARLLDTRRGLGAASAAKIGPKQTLDLQVAGRGGVSQVATAAVLNVTGIKADDRTFLTIFPTGEAVPEAASLNPGRNRINGNLVVAKLGRGGSVSIYNDSANIDLTVDVTGFFL